MLAVLLEHECVLLSAVLSGNSHNRTYSSQKQKRKAFDCIASFY
jgi:hypothetical protein